MTVKRSYDYKKFIHFIRLLILSSLIYPLYHALITHSLRAPLITQIGPQIRNVSTEKCMLNHLGFETKMVAL